MKTLRILLTGGGTGGHIYPMIAVAEELKKQSNELGLFIDMRYFGGAYEYAQEIVDSGIEFVPVISSKLRRYFSLLNIIDGFKFVLSLFQLLWKIYWFMPDVVFSKGGPGALAVVLISRFYFIPVVIHESDSIPGFTNNFSGKMAKKIFLAFSSAADNFKNKDAEVVGNPVRESLFSQSESLISAEDGDPVVQARKGFGLNPNEPVILILGGSQGSEIINNFILENLEDLVIDYQILHQVGKKNFDGYKKEYEFINKEWTEAERNRYIYRPFFGSDLSDAIIASDIIIARAGAGTIFEVAAFGRPSVLIPLPDAANDHQNENARFYSNLGAAIVFKQENLLGHLFIKQLKSLMEDKDLLKKMGESARIFYRPDSARIIAKHLLTYVS